MATVPDPPVPETLSQASAHSLYFRFSKAGTGGATITDYNVRYANNLNFTGAQTFALGYPGATITGLARKTRYYAQVRARNSVGWSDWSRIIYGDTIAELPGPPRPQYIDAQGQTGLHYIFIGPADDGGAPVQEYQIGYGTDPNGPQSFIGSNGDSFIYGLSRYTVYYVWTRARNEVGWGPWSDRVQIQTHAYVPTPPSPVVVDNVTQTAFHYVFRGEDNGGADILEWQVGYSTDPNNVTSIVGSNGEVTIGGLAPATTYFVWARGRNVEGWSGWSARSQARTVAGARLLVWGQWKEAIPYVKVNGVWRLAEPHVKSVGLWKKVL